MAEIRVNTYIEAPVELCFDLARDVTAHAQSAAFSNERIVEPGKTSGLLEVGDLVTFEGIHFGLRQRFTARIVEMNRPRSFADIMVHGSFKWLRHVHDFQEDGRGTLMRDILIWRAPLGPIGTIGDWLFLKRHMEWFVRTKQLHLKAIAESRQLAAAEKK